MVGGLDLTLQVKLGPEDVAEIAGSGPLGEVLAEEMRIWRQFNDERNEHQWNSPHDPILALWVTNPDLFVTNRVSVNIDDDGESRWHHDARGTVLLLDTPDPEALAKEIVRRIVVASSVAGLNPARPVDGEH